MISFILLVSFLIIVCSYYLVTDIIKFNKIDYKMILSIILLSIIIYLKSINL